MQGPVYRCAIRASRLGISCRACRSSDSQTLKPETLQAPKPKSLNPKGLNPEIPKA